MIAHLNDTSLVNQHNRSALTIVDKRWAMIKEVRPANNRAMPCCNRRSVWVSTRRLLHQSQNTGISHKGAGKGDLLPLVGRKAAPRVPELRVITILGLVIP